MDSISSATGYTNVQWCPSQLVKPSNPHWTGWLYTKSNHQQRFYSCIDNTEDIITMDQELVLVAH